MKISYKGDYATKIILDLADNYQDKLVHIEDIAKRQDIPQNYLEQILLVLKKGGFVRSKKGPHGGYALTRPPQDISLGDIVRFIEGPIYPISCVDPKAPQTCQEVGKCSFYGIWKEVAEAVAKIVDNIDFAQIRQRAEKLDKGALTYHI